MTWIWLAIAAHFCWAVVNVGDKYVVSSRVRSPYVYMIWLSFLGLLAVFIIPFIQFEIPDQPLMFLIALGGALYFFGGLPYIKAMQIEDVTRINVWWSFIPLFTLAIGWFTIDEKLNLQQLFAFFLLVGGAVFASMRWKQNGLKFSKAIWLMMTATLAYSIYGVIVRYSSQIISFASVFVWVHVFLGLFAVASLSIPFLKKDFLEESRRAGKGLWGIVLGISMFDHVGILFSTWALSLGPVAIVFAMEGFQALFVFLMAMGISAFTPISLEKDLDKYNIMFKILALTLMIGGIWMLNVG
ncbi:EamA family transporter [Candidatus Peregrinibacteria bacterium]|nr:EamA family transporter [Candidatus Peregrinibacteria bacterium]